MTRRAALSLAACFAVALISPRPALAADPSPEQRQAMAEVHQKMADCLRSSRLFADCRSEMVAACHDMTGAGGCPMMGAGQGGMGPGMMGPGMGPGMMHTPAPPAEPPKK